MVFSKTLANFLERKTHVCNPSEHVTTEVKELANQTAQATDEISNKVQTIQSDTGDAVQAIEEISNVIK